MEGVGERQVANSGAALFSVSDTGSLIYVPGPAAAASDQSVLALIDRKGVVDAAEGSARYATNTPASPQTAHASRSERATERTAVISTYELSGASAVRRLTFEGNNRFPIWSADGSASRFNPTDRAISAIFWQPADGGTAERLTTPDPGTSHTPESWSPDGKVLLFSATKGPISSLWTFSLKDRKATLVRRRESVDASDQRDVLT